MKSLVIFLLATFLLVAYVGAQNHPCEDGGGVCLPNKNIQRSCERELPYACDEGSICCWERKFTKIRHHLFTSSNGVKLDDFQGKIDRFPEEEEKGVIKTRNDSVRVISRRGTNCKCGQANNAHSNVKQRIVGGGEVSPKNRYPWMVYLIIHLRPNYYEICGGSIINDRYVLTAAHCFCKSTPDTCPSPESLEVLVADHNIKSSDDDVEGVTKVLRVDHYEIHPSFFYQPWTDRGDIALLRLKEPLDLTAHKEIKPVCLPKDETKTYEGYDAIVAGWGLQNSLDPHSTSDVLLEIPVTIWDPDCNGYRFNNDAFINTLFCAVSVVGGKAHCSGDSGGPLVVKEGNTHTQVGIVSNHVGGKCGFPGSISRYTRVTMFLNWIAKKTEDAIYCSD